MRSTRAVDCLLPKVRQKILTLTLLNEENAWYLNDLSRRLKTRPSSLQRELASLVQAGILRLSRDGNRSYYSANRTCPIFPDLRGLMAKTCGFADVLRKALAPLSDEVRLAFVYGPVAAGEDDIGAGVDLIAVTDLLLAEVARALRPAEAQTGRPIHPTVFSEDEYRSRTSRGHHLLTSVLRQPKLMILGTEDDLAAMSSSRPAEA